MPFSREALERRSRKSQQESEAVKTVLLTILQEDSSVHFREEELRRTCCKILRARLSWWQKFTPGGLALNKDNVNVALLVSGALSKLLDEGKVDQPEKGCYSLPKY